MFAQCLILAGCSTTTSSSITASRISSSTRAVLPAHAKLKSFQEHHQYEPNVAKRCWKRATLRQPDYALVATNNRLAPHTNNKQSHAGPDAVLGHTYTEKKKSKRYRPLISQAPTTRADIVRAAAIKFKYAGYVLSQTPAAVGRVSEYDDVQVVFCVSKCYSQR